ncbi:LysM domain-containing protein [Pseudogracilibacillus sp. SO30301A]
MEVLRILAANPEIDPDNLFIGHYFIPACPPNHKAYLIQPGDTLYELARIFNVTIASILEANPSVNPQSFCAWLSGFVFLQHVLLPTRIQDCN